MVHSRCDTCITFYLNLCWWRLDFELLVTYHSTFVIYLHSYTVFKPLVVMFFRTYVVSAPRCILCEKRLRFKPKYIHFVYSYVVYVAFPSCLRRQVSVCCFSKSSVFSTRGARGHAVVMVTNDPFSDHFRFFFLVVSSLVPNRPWRFRIGRHLSSLSGKFALSHSVPSLLW